MMRQGACGASLLAAVLLSTSCRQQEVEDTYYGQPVLREREEEKRTPGSQPVTPLNLASGILYSTNPGYDSLGSEEPATGVAFEFSANHNEPKLAMGCHLAAADFGSGEEGLVEGNVFARTIPVDYTVVWQTQPDVIDPAGLHPRLCQRLIAGTSYYTYTYEKVDFNETSMSALDSTCQEHMVKHSWPMDLSGEPERGQGLRFLFGYSWRSRDWSGLNDYRAESGTFGLHYALDIKEFDKKRTNFYLTHAEPIAGMDIALQTPCVLVELGWINMHGFDGPVADPNDHLAAFHGLVGASRRLGDFVAAVGVSCGPKPSYVSNYQIETEVAAGFSAQLDKCDFAVVVGYLEADRSTGPDLSAWTASASASYGFSENWHARMRLDWIERDSEALGEGYRSFSVFLGLSWGAPLDHL